MAPVLSSFQNKNLFLGSVLFVSFSRFCYNTLKLLQELVKLDNMQIERLMAPLLVVLPAHNPARSGEGGEMGLFWKNGGMISLEPPCGSMMSILNQSIQQTETPSSIPPTLLNVCSAAHITPLNIPVVSSRRRHPARGAEGGDWVSRFKDAFCSLASFSEDTPGLKQFEKTAVPPHCSLLSAIGRSSVSIGRKRYPRGFSAKIEKEGSGEKNQALSGVVARKRKN